MVQTTFPPRCESSPKVTNFTPLDEGLFVRAPLPPQQLETVQYGDYPSLLRAIRTLIEQYNDVVLKNIKKSSLNRDKQIENHNDFIDEFNLECDKLHEDYNSSSKNIDRNKVLGIF